MSNVKPIPEGLHSLTPHLMCTDATKAIEFYKKAFGAVELSRSTVPGGKIIHAALQIGDSRFFVNDPFPEFGAPAPAAGAVSPVTIHLAVENVDEVVKRAVAAGAKVTMPVTDMFWGDRYGKLEDQFGHQWSVATHIRDVSPEEMDAASKAMFSSPSMKPPEQPKAKEPKEPKKPASKPAAKKKK